MVNGRSANSSIPVALYVPNVLCYIRIVTAFVGLHYATTTTDDRSRPVAAVLIWIFSASLDLLDGILARKLRQTSSMGIFLDIAADNILRSCSWVAAAVVHHDYHGWVILMATSIVCLEWLTMVATQIHAIQKDGKHWKQARDKDPWIVKFFFSNNFINPAGFLGIYGLFASGLFTYGCQFDVFTANIPLFRLWMYLAYVGRLLSMGIEFRFLISFFNFLASEKKE